jgi:N-formylglutamate deformylase
MTAFRVIESDGPIITTAIHAGHELRPDVLRDIRLSEADRLHEEDPYTDRLSDIGATQVVVSRSRFEVDLNRPRESCVYLTPADAWGLEVWQSGAPTAETIYLSLAEYDAFYTAMRDLLRRTLSRYGGFIVLDVHSYNHRRTGPSAEAASVRDNPEVNLGTGTLDRQRWKPVIDVFLEHMGSAGYDARENVKFKGGAFAGWAHREFPRNGCVLAVEFKKTFMDEWTGVPDMDRVQKTSLALLEMIPMLEESLGRVVAEPSV